MKTLKPVAVTPEQKHMQAAVKKLQRYMETYDMQHGYLDYSDETFIEDVLYGLGIALDSDKFSFAQGFSEFKKVLGAHLEKHK